MVRRRRLPSFTAGELKAHQRRRNAAEGPRTYYGTEHDAYLRIEQCTQIHLRKGGGLAFQATSWEESPIFLASLRHGPAYLGFALLRAPAEESDLLGLGKAISAAIPVTVKDVLLDFDKRDTAIAPLLAGLASGRSRVVFADDPHYRMYSVDKELNEVDGPPLEQALGLALRLCKAAGCVAHEKEFPWFKWLEFTQPLADAYRDTGILVAEFCRHIARAADRKEMALADVLAGAFQSEAFQTASSRLSEWAGKQRKRSTIDVYPTAL
ncbi:hypothetical protein [Paraburkholderia sp. SIMBA_054]|uniref:hypothetical protein n=1 Tax=Paraburkholderia sp. SIMBA_054 TaxID=3085795 RepID=UPI00397E4B3C